MGETQRRTAKISSSYRKSVSVNPCPMTNLRPEVEFMQFLRICIHYRHKNHRNGVPRQKLLYLYTEITALNFNMAADFKREVVVLSKLRMRSEKSPK